MGQVEPTPLSLSHFSTHSAWYSWRQGRRRICAPSWKGSKHTLHNAFISFLLLLLLLVEPPNSCLCLLLCLLVCLLHFANGCPLHPVRVRSICGFMLCLTDKFSCWRDAGICCPNVTARFALQVRLLCKKRAALIALCAVHMHRQQR